jgi:MSHA pilin protein MshA
MNTLPQHRTPRAQAGFTLVELVTVILILGVLAAVALPRYADLQGSARAAKVEATAGAIKAAAGLAKAQAVATGVSCAAATSGSVSMEGATIGLNHCYPKATAAGILTAANVTPSAEGWSAATVTGTSGDPNTSVSINLTAATAPANCSIAYTSPTAVNTLFTVTVVTSGC